MLVCNPLMTSDVEHLSMCLFAICMSSLAQFLTGLFLFIFLVFFLLLIFLLDFKNSLCILNTSPFQVGVL